MVREVADRVFLRELTLDRSLILVTFFHRLDPNHRVFVSLLGDLASSYDDWPQFRCVDLVENPSLIRRFTFASLPSVRLYLHGIEQGRWEGEVDLTELVRKLEAFGNPR